MEKKEIGDQVRYYLAIAWMNSLGLPCSIWQGLTSRDEGEEIKDFIRNELEKDIIKLFLWIGIILLIVGLIIDSTWLLVLCILPFVMALLGMMKRSFSSFMDYFAGEGSGIGYFAPNGAFFIILK